MCPIVTQDRWLPAKNAAYRHIRDEVVIVDTTRNYIITLNETGSALWQLLDGRTLAEAVAGLTQRFDVSKEQLVNDVFQFISLLAQKGLVVLEDHNENGKKAE